jgi:hypothetical protein
MQTTSVDLVFFWIMVLVAFAIGMACSAWMLREERRDARGKLAEAAQIVGLVDGLVTLSGVRLPAAVKRQITNFVGSVRG